MNSSVNKKTMSLATLMNRRVFPALTLAVTILAFVPNHIMFLTLKGMIPAERIAKAECAVFFIQYIPAGTALLVILTILYAAYVIDRQVSRPIGRLAHWADERYRSGDGMKLRMRTRIEEIVRLASVFARLFDEQLHRVAELKTLVGATRHNIRNHLANVSSNAQFVLDGKRDAAGSARKIVAEVDTAVHILDANAAISRNYSHILGDPPEEIVLADLVYDILDQFDAAADEKGVTVDAEIPPSQLVTVSHRRNVESVIHNLVENAIKYTPSGGRITLAVRVCPDAKAGSPSELEIEVADTGIGIPDEDKPHIFEREYRSRTATGIKGDGLGLAFVDSVAALYGGSVEVRDNSPKGTVFTVRLPSPSSRPNHEPTSSPARRRMPRAVSWLLKTESGWFYSALTTVPICGLFGAFLFYLALGKGSILALATITASGYVILGSFLLIGIKIFRLRVLRKKRLAKSRVGIVVRNLVANLLLIIGFLIWLGTSK